MKKTIVEVLTFNESGLTELGGKQHVHILEAFGFMCSRGFLPASNLTHKNHPFSSPVTDVVFIKKVWPWQIKKEKKKSQSIKAK